MTETKKTVTAQEHAEKIIRKYGGKKMTGKDKDKYDMRDGVKREKEAKGECVWRFRP